MTGVNVTASRPVATSARPNEGRERIDLRASTVLRRRCAPPVTRDQARRSTTCEDLGGAPERRAREKTVAELRFHRLNLRDRGVRRNDVP